MVIHIRIAWDLLATIAIVATMITHSSDSSLIITVLICCCYGIQDHMTTVLHNNNLILVIGRAFNVVGAKSFNSHWLRPHHRIDSCRNWIILLSQFDIVDVGGMVTHQLREV